MNIDKIDSNFKNISNCNDDISLYDIEDGCFKIYGVYKDANEDGFVRMSPRVAKTISKSIEYLNKNTSGGRVRFKTDSKVVFLKCEMPGITTMMSMPYSGSSGFDIYADGLYAGSFTPSTELIKDYIISENNGDCGKVFSYSGTVKFDDNRIRDIVINFPPYNCVNKVYIGVEQNARVLAGDKYSASKPVVFYGSSITQGGCVSRPGNVYAAVLSRKYNFDFINLGFSGNAKAEDEIAEYIANLDMLAFVYDYDCNAPDTDYYRDTHYKMYKVIRDKNPDLPIIMATRPSVCAPDKEKADGHTAREVVEKRIEVALETLKRAKAEGDDNIYFISGMDMMHSFDSEMMTVDGCHPNDFGSFCIAKAFEKIFDVIFKAVE